MPEVRRDLITRALSPRLERILEKCRSAISPNAALFLSRYLILFILTTWVDRATPVAAPLPEQIKPKNTPKYIRWSELLRRVFGIETVCQKCQTPLRLIALIKTEHVAKKILTAMHLPTEIPELHPARPPPQAAGGGEDWVN